MELEQLIDFRNLGETDLGFSAKFDSSVTTVEDAIAFLQLVNGMVRAAQDEFNRESDEQLVLVADVVVTSGSVKLGVNIKKDGKERLSAPQKNRLAAILLAIIAATPPTIEAVAKLEEAHAHHVLAEAAVIQAQSKTSQEPINLSEECLSYIEKIARDNNAVWVQDKHASAEFSFEGCGFKIQSKIQRKK
jgi:hypothetical protein